MKTRRNFIKAGMLTGAALVLPRRSIEQPLTPEFMQQRPAPIDPQLVRDFVSNAHGNLQKVKELLDREPGLLNASWDWGGGDFETAMNAAGHTGHVEIVEFLLSKGARMDVFCAAMLGKLDVVKAILSMNADLKTSKGPHGLMLLHHAQQGKKNAEAVLSYLIEIGAS